MTAREFAPILRIIIRYLTPLVASSPFLAGVMTGISEDPAALQVAAALIVMGINEGWYIAAKNRGGAT